MQRGRQERRADATYRSDAWEDPARRPCPQPHPRAGATRRPSKGSREAAVFSSFCPFAHSATKRPRGGPYCLRMRLFRTSDCKNPAAPHRPTQHRRTQLRPAYIRGGRLLPRAPYRHSVMLSNKFSGPFSLDTVVLFGLLGSFLSDRRPLPELFHAGGVTLPLLSIGVKLSPTPNPSRKQGKGNSACKKQRGPGCARAARGGVLSRPHVRNRVKKKGTA